MTPSAKLRLSSLLVAVLGLLLLHRPALQDVGAVDLPTCPVSGTLSWDSTFTPDCVWVVSGLTVPAGITLTVEEGTIVKVALSSYLAASSGNVVATGTVDNPVIITSIRDDSAGGDSNGDGGATVPGRGDWLSIQVNYEGSISLTHTQVRYGGSYYGAIYNNSYTSSITL